MIKIEEIKKKIDTLLIQIDDLKTLIHCRQEVFVQKLKNGQSEELNNLKFELKSLKKTKQPTVIDPFVKIGNK